MKSMNQNRKSLTPKHPPATHPVHHLLHHFFIFWCSNSAAYCQRIPLHFLPDILSARDMIIYIYRHITVGVTHKILQHLNVQSKAQQKAVNKYVKNNYDRINVTFPKGQKEILREHAKKQNESVNAFIVRSVSETMERDNQKAK